MPATAPEVKRGCEAGSKSNERPLSEMPTETSK
jgi:hypothetical protein